MPSIVRLEPACDIVFPKDLHTQVTTVLKIQNVHKGQVAFKVRTTAAKQYLVRPSAGILKRGEGREVQIVMQPRESAVMEGGTDRFLVQGVPFAGTEPPSREQWQTFEKAAINEHKLFVRFQDDPVDDSISKGGSMPSIAGRPVGSQLSGAELRAAYDGMLRDVLQLEKARKLAELQVAAGGSRGGYGWSRLLMAFLIGAFIPAVIAALQPYLPANTGSFFAEVAVPLARGREWTLDQVDRGVAQLAVLRAWVLGGV
mmetsp:Transcript_27977/g.63659  ORF Transcript_27977/g.63659 Transcript_27977/m.63659 type:complete len:257 (+) Transcript_27977:58-828(+)